MSRTLYYGIKGEIELTDIQIDSFLNLSKKYQKNYEWTCETVFFPSYVYLKHRENPPDKKPKKIKPSTETKKIAEDIKRTVETNIPGVEIYAFNADDIPEDFGKYEIDHSTKVGGNESNAHTVIKFVIEASMILPERIFYLFDDGYSIYCPLLIKNGRSMPYIDNIKESLKRWKEKSRPDVNLAIYYNKLIKKNWKYTNINRFIRPLKDNAYLIKRNQVKTINFGVEDITSLPSMMKDFLISERIEQLSYYDDVESYPEEP